MTRPYSQMGEGETSGAIASAYSSMIPKLINTDSLQPDDQSGILLLGRCGIAKMAFVVQITENE